MKILPFIFSLILAVQVFSQENYSTYTSGDREELFYDEFENNNNSWWEDNSGEASGKVKDGFYHCSAKSDKSQSFKKYIYINENSDFEIEAAIKIANNASTGGSGIIWGFEEKNKEDDLKAKRYFFGMAKTGKITIGKFLPEWAQIMPWKLNAHVSRNDFNKLTIRKIESTNYFFVNEAFVFSAPYEPFFGQKIGFHIAVKADVQIDFLRISYLKRANENYQPEDSATIISKNNKILNLKSAVDHNIPEDSVRIPDRFALVIGNVDYSSKQKEDSAGGNVEFARNDANMFKEYAVKVLGIPEMNITFILDATTSEMNQGIDKINKIIKIKEGKAEIFVYYAGHGLPDLKTKEACLIPVDVNASNFDSAITLNHLYLSLTEFTTKRITLFFDTYFTEAERNLGLQSTCSVRIKPKDDVLKGNIIVFTASSGEQNALPFKSKNHGLFTYYLLKKLRETNGNITYKELSDYLYGEVKLKSILINNKEQYPQTNVSPEAKDTWENWKIK